MAKDKRPKLSATLANRFRENRIRRVFLRVRIEELDAQISRALDGTTKSGEKRVLAWARERRRLADQVARLPVMRKPRGTRKRGGKRKVAQPQGALFRFE